MNWFNVYGLAIMVIIMIPNILFAINSKNKDINTYKNKTVTVLEQIGRYGCMFFMVFNIPYTYFNFWFQNAKTLYLSLNGLLCFLYLLFWVICRKNEGKLKALSLSIIPSCIFIFSGIMLANIPLIAFSVLFAVCHILISYKNTVKKKGKNLQDMTLEELLQLFPIFLTEQNPYWEKWYEKEKKNLKKILPFSLEYHHIGSTAIKGIWAKPIIDILIVANDAEQMKEIADLLQSKLYIIMSKDEKRISLNKGYTENGFAKKVFHLHIRLANDIDEIYFRDYLNANADIAKEYEKLKLELWKKYEHNRDAYTEAKGDFIKKYTDIAKRNLQ